MNSDCERPRLQSLFNLVLQNDGHKVMGQILNLCEKYKLERLENMILDSASNNETNDWVYYNSLVWMILGVVTCPTTGSSTLVRHRPKPCKYIEHWMEYIWVSYKSSDKRHDDTPPR